MLPFNELNPVCLFFSLLWIWGSLVYELPLFFILREIYGDWCFLLYLV